MKESTTVVTSELIYSIVAEVLLLAISVAFLWQLRKYHPSATHAFFCGMPIGLGTILWPWSAIAILIILIVVFGAMKVYSRKIFWNIIFGFLTPLWLYLPYYLYQVIMNYAL